MYNIKLVMAHPLDSGGQNKEEDNPNSWQHQEKETLEAQEIPVQIAKRKVQDPQAWLERVQTKTTQTLKG